MNAKGPGAGWSWLVSGFTAFKRDPGRTLGAAALLALCMLAPSMLQLLARPQGSAALALLGVMMLAGGVVYPILIGGFMRIIDAKRNQRPVRALMLFEPFRPGQGGMRIALFGLCMLVVYVVVLALLMMTVGHGLWTWYLQLLTLQAQGTPPHALSPLPHGSGLTLALMTVFFLFYGGAYAIGIGQVALRGESALHAARDGFSGALKNALPLLVLAICGVLALLVLALAIGLLMALFIVLGGLVSKVFGMILAGLVYVVMLLLIVPFMMAVYYAIWQDVAGDGPGNRTDLPLSNSAG